jgi:excisionase family DNA binding protein
MSELLTYPDVQRLLNVSRRTVKRLITRKVLKCIDLGHRTKRFAPADVERAIAKMKGDER